MKALYYWVDKNDPHWKNHNMVPNLREDPFYTSKKEAKKAYREYANDPDWQGADFNPALQMFKIKVEKC